MASGQGAPDGLLAKSLIPESLLPLARRLRPRDLPHMSRPKALSDMPNITILGGGPVGWLAALALADACPPGTPLRIVTGRRMPAEDGRAAAIIGKSMDILRDLQLEGTFRAAGAPLAAIRLIDATGRLLRAPTTMFRATDIGDADFGVSLSTARIVSLLAERARARGGIGILQADATAVERRGEDGFTLALDDGQRLDAPFLVAADGQRSLAREAGGISTRAWAYPQTALTFAVTHQRDHEDVSTEFHTADGPFTLVPSGPLASSVVWMTTPERAGRLMGMDDLAFAQEAERTCRSVLGKLSMAGARGAYPMRGLMAERFAAPGIALVGETGHAFPPIGAQGLNLGFRDVATLAEAMGKTLARGEDIAAADALAAWDMGRRRDAGLRTAGVDLFNRSLLAGLLPVDALRGAGLLALGSVPPLRRMAMRFGMGR
jgi:2-octaprenyl-6-methoxyphenol hydroxylase